MIDDGIAAWDVHVLGFSGTQSWKKPVLDGLGVHQCWLPPPL